MANNEIKISVVIEGQKAKAGAQGVKKDLDDISGGAKKAAREVDGLTKSFQGMFARIRDFAAGGFIVAGVERAVAIARQQAEQVVKDFREGTIARTTLTSAARTAGRGIGGEFVDAEQYRRLGLSRAQAQTFEAGGIRLAEFAGRRDEDLLLRRIQDLAASRGIQASKAGEILGQLQRGEDTAQDKLGLRGNVQVYAEFAKRVGTTGDKLDEATKASLRYQEVIRAGAQVEGEAAQRLKTTVGQYDLMGAKLTDLRAAFGEAALGGEGLATQLSAINQGLEQMLILIQAAGQKGTFSAGFFSQVGPNRVFREGNRVLANAAFGSYGVLDALGLGTRAFRPGEDLRRADREFYASANQPAAFAGSFGRGGQQDSNVLAAREAYAKALATADRLVAEGVKGALLLQKAEADVRRLKVAGDPFGSIREKYGAEREGILGEKGIGQLDRERLLRRSAHAEALELRRAEQDLATAERKTLVDLGTQLSDDKLANILATNRERVKALTEQYERMGLAGSEGFRKIKNASEQVGQRQLAAGLTANILEESNLGARYAEITTRRYKFGKGLATYGTGAGYELQKRIGYYRNETTKERINRAFRDRRAIISEVEAGLDAGVFSATERHRIALREADQATLATLEGIKPGAFGPINRRAYGDIIQRARGELRGERANIIKEEKERREVTAALAGGLRDLKSKGIDAGGFLAAIVDFTKKIDSLPAITQLLVRAGAGTVIDSFTGTPSPATAPAPTPTGNPNGGGYFGVD